MDGIELAIIQYASDVGATIHHLKTWQPFYDQVKSGEKPFELRINDRHYRKDDVLVLYEYDPETKVYLGGRIYQLVTCVVKDVPEEFGLKDGYAILGIKDYPYSTPDTKEG